MPLCCFIIKLTHLVHPLSTAETHAADDCSDAGSNEDEAWRRLKKMMHYVFVATESQRVTMSLASSFQSLYQLSFWALQ